MRVFPVFRRKGTHSGVLVLTLLVLVLLSVIVLGLLASISNEKQMIEASFQQRRATAVAMLGYQAGVAQLRYALGTGTSSWDNPYANFATNPPTFFWSVSPGLLTRWSYSQSSPQTNIALFSQSFDAANTNLVNLNRILTDGSYPIIGGANPPNVSVQFVNLLQSPSSPPSAANPIIARYAFWIDDESAKININVADGTRPKYSADWMKNSLGLGSPTEISLMVLPQTNGLISSSTASNMVYVARNITTNTTPYLTDLISATNSFHSPREILRVSGATADLYTNNIFSLTDYSRSPDINIFGQPKMAILPVLGDDHQGDNSWGGGQEMAINGISLQPETEIYPTQYQLSPVWIKWPLLGQNGAGYFHPWPLAFRGEHPEWSTGRTGGLLNDILLCGNNTNYCWDNGNIISRYMSGTNAAGTPIQWPVFSSTTSTQGFTGKYSFHQIDEIAIQILSFGSKLICSDYPHPLYPDYPGIFCDFNGDSNWAATGDYGFRFHTAPFLMDGWLSGQWVIGLGRTPKVTGLGVQLLTTGSITTVVNGKPSYQPPELMPTFYIEEWIPGAYRGGNTTAYTLSGNWELGGASSQYKVPQALNAADVGVNGGTGISEAQSWLPRTSDPAGDTQTNNVWANQLLRNDQGIDFNNNYNSSYDPDQYLAREYHTPWAQTGLPADTNYFGAAQNIYFNGTDTPFRMAALIDNQAAVEWQPGTQRCATSQFSQSVPVSMQSSADGGILHLSGGISVIDCLDGGDENSFTDPVPLEAIRGPAGGLADDAFIDAVPTGSYPYSVSSWDGTNAMIGYTPPNPITGQVTSRERNIAAVIPVNTSVPVPLPGASPPSNVTNLYYTTTDPLVNKYPGDWHFTTNSFPAGWPAGPNNVTSYPQDAFLQAIAANGGDPDSFWIPQADVGFSSRDKIASQTLIPRSARMPNIGYLQYVRTGIMPDVETNTTYYQYPPGNQNVTLEHGTPFRLFSYAPVNDASYAASQESSTSTQPYPDWALLDLFYIPSILNSFGGPYANYTNLAPFGTYGGATAGRINPNGSVIYTTNVNFPQPGVSRLLPLQASLYGLHVNQTYDSSTASDQSLWAYKDVPAVTTAMDATTSQTLASNISYFISTNGPLRMPAEICDVPQVAALHAPINLTRNDLVRQMVGALTTQSNVFSVWTVGQVIQKSPGNTGYGEFESGDQVLGEVRLHLIVERYLDPGADGIYGNTSNAGRDGVTSSLDDPVDPIYHPFQPKYLYRIVRSEEVR